MDAQIINVDESSIIEEPQKYEISEAQSMLLKFWPTVTVALQNQNTELPLARIKKIMKLDEDVKMISAEAPVLFSKAAEIFISELALRSWVHTEENKRRTLQKNDIAMAVSKFDQFDFLIDIVPRNEMKSVKREDVMSMVDGNLQYYVHANDNTTTTSTHVGGGGGGGNSVGGGGGDNGGGGGGNNIVTLTDATTSATSSSSDAQHQVILHQQQQQQQQSEQQDLQQQQQQQQIIQIPQLMNDSNIIIQDGQGQVLHQVEQLGISQNQISEEDRSSMDQQLEMQNKQEVSPPTSTQTANVFQQIVGEDGKTRNVPIYLTPQQLESISSQLVGKGIGQSTNIVIQDSSIQ